jgi:hypothetical protein
LKTDAITEAVFMEKKEPGLKEIWNQKKIPVVFYKGKKNPLLLRLPFSKDNRFWLKADHRINPIWEEDHKYWIIPKAWFNDFIKRSLARYGNIYLIQSYRPYQKCAPACWNAEGVDCECSCMGENHGTGKPDNKWFVISETCAVSLGENKYSCRLLLPGKRDIIKIK